MLTGASSWEEMVDLLEAWLERTREGVRWGRAKIRTNCKHDLLDFALESVWFVQLCLRRGVRSRTVYKAMAMAALGQQIISASPCGCEQRQSDLPSTVVQADQAAGLGNSAQRPHWGGEERWHSTSARGIEETGPEAPSGLSPVSLPRILGECDPSVGWQDGGRTICRGTAGARLERKRLWRSC